MINRVCRTTQRSTNPSFVAPIQRAFHHDPRQTALRKHQIRLSRYHMARSLVPVRHFSRTTDSSTSPKPSSTPKAKNMMVKAIKATQSAVVMFIRVFTHPKQSWQGFKEGYHHFVDTLWHYWKGTKLLWSDMKACAGLLWAMTRGHKLTWREKRQLQRTTLDILRFIPMFFFIVIPALEVLLPVALYLFPNMLPSTFATKNQKSQREKKLLRARLNSAEFLSNIHSKYLERMKDDADLATVKQILKKFQRNEYVTPEEIAAIAPYFRDHITLDSLPTNQLNTLCNYMHIPSFGSNAILRERLRQKIKKIRKEDAAIMKTGGISTVTDREVRDLVSERGMRVNKNLDALRVDLSGWMDLTQTQKIPTSLLVLSRVLMISASHSDNPQEAIGDVLKVLPDAVDEVLVDAAGDDDNYEVERRVVERHQKMIQEEKEEKKKTKEKGVPVDAVDEKLEREFTKQKVMPFLKSVTDENMVETEKKKLDVLRTQHKQHQELLKTTERYLEEWTTLLGTEELTASTPLSHPQMQELWTRSGFAPERFEESFKTWDTNQDDYVRAKRAKQMLEEEKQKVEETFETIRKKAKLSDVVALEDAEIDQKEEKQDAKLKKTAAKVSSRLQKMFDKLEKDISKTEAKQGEHIRVQPEDLTLDKVREILHSEFDKEINQVMVNEILANFKKNPSPHPSDIKKEIEEQWYKNEEEMRDEAEEELDVSDFESDKEEEEKHKQK